LKPGCLGASVGFGARLVVMAAIVASLLYWPAAIAIVIGFALFGVPAETVVTAGGTLGVFTGMAALWLVLFTLVLPYAVWVFPWNVKLDGFRK
jgi:hypothetical protein